MKIKEVIRHIKNSLSRSDFLRNVLTLMTGTALAQLIPLLIAPILSRIYTPAEFGRLALYLSIVQILGSVANGRYELAIVLPKEKKKGVQLTLLSIVITICVSFLSLLAVLFFSKEIANAMGDPKLSSWLFFVPFSVLMIGLFNALNYYNTREKNFKDIAKANVFKSLGGSLTQLLLGMIKYISGGLIIGQVMSHFFGNIKMIKIFLKSKDIINEVKWEDLKSLAIRYINFPKYSVGGIFLNTLSLNIINFFISSIYSLSSVGFYSYAYKYLGFPLTLIGNSIGQVYFQKLAEVKSNNEAALNEFKKAAKKLIILSIVIFFPLFFIVEDLFAFVFGEQWRVAGLYAKVLIPLMGVRFIVSPLAITLIGIENQGKEFLVHLSILLISILIWIYVYFNGLELEFAIKLYSIILSLTYVLILVTIYYILLKNKDEKED